MQLPTIESKKQTPEKKSTESDYLILPSISKSSSKKSNDSEQQRNVFYSRSSQSSTPESGLSDYNELPDKKKNKAKTISKYYYLKPLYTHPEREQVIETKVKKKAFEIPQELSLKVL